MCQVQATTALEAVFFIAGPPVTRQDDMQDAIAENEQRIAVHEAVCAERYLRIQESFKSGEQRMSRTDKKLGRIELALYFLVVAVVGGRELAFKLFEVFVK